MENGSKTLDPAAVIGMRYTAAARNIWDTGEYTAWRVMPDVGPELPDGPPLNIEEREVPRTWVALWMDDNDAINPNVVRAEVVTLNGGE
jgi:hypothetical protein